MKSAVETLSPTRAKLTVEVPFEELKPSLDAAYKKIAQQVTVPGFRKGKVPAAVIDRQIGRGAALDEAINDALPEALLRGAGEQQPPAAGSAGHRGHQVRGRRGAGVHRRGGRAARDHPPAYDGLEASVDDAVVTDQDVEEQLESLRTRFGALKDVERAAGDGDYVVIDLKASKDGEVVEGAELTGMSYQVGRGGMVEGLDEALTGMAAGETKTFASQLVGGDAVGDEVEIEVTVTGVKEQELPELDDEFAQMASEFDTSASSPRTSAPGLATASASSRRPPRATRCSRSCSTWSRSRSPRVSWRTS